MLSVDNPVDASGPPRAAIVAKVRQMDTLLAPLIEFVHFTLRLVYGLGGIVLGVLRPALRFLGAVLMLATVIALAADLTSWQTTGNWWHFDSLGYHIATLAPQTLKNVGSSIGRATHPWVWDPLLTSLIAQPAWIIFFLLGVLLIYAGRERKQINIFIN
jgi:hypothetical protein